MRAKTYRLGVQPHRGSIRYVLASRDAGLRRAVVSSNANGRDVLHEAGIAGLFDARVDPSNPHHRHLRSKPAPDMFLAAARIVGLPPPAVAVFENTSAGVAAGRAGAFGFVVGVDHTGDPDALRSHGADTAVSDLSELLPPG